MKEKAIQKINMMGKVGTILVLISKIFVSILLALSIIGFVGILCLPSDFCTVKIDGNAKVQVDLSTFGVNLGEIDEQKIEEGVKKNAKISYGGNEFDVNGVEVEDSKINIGAAADLTEFNVKDFAWALAGAMVYLILLLISLIYAGRLTKAFRGCQSPFEEPVIRRMKQFAYSLIPWAVASSLVGALASQMWMAGGGVSLNLDFTIIVVVLVILAFAYIFQYGAVLQKESDETL